MNKKTFSKAITWVVTLALALAVIPAVPLSVQAADSDTDENEPTGTFDFTTETWDKSGVDHKATYADSVLTVHDGANIAVTGTAATGKRIMVETGGKANITLNNVSITAPGENKSALAINPNTDLTLTLIGNNTLTGGGNAAGINVYINAKLTINGSGKLTATGGDKGAGIGGNDNIPSGTIVINSGEIIAKGTNGGAGIGGGAGASGGNTTIKGGNITATGGANSNNSLGGAGIGSGATQAQNIDGTIIIEGGIVTATGANDAAGIGGGGPMGGGGTITIKGGIVTATASFGAGIGGGATGEKGLLAINGDCIVFATGDTYRMDMTATNKTKGILVYSTNPNYIDGTAFYGESVTIPQDATVTIPPTLSLTIPAGKTLTIPDTTTLANKTQITNNGIINNLGKITNDGTIVNNGTINNGGAIYNDGGAIINNGTISGNDVINITVPEITTTSLLSGTYGTAYSQTLTATGGGIEWTTVPGYPSPLPGGLALNASTGVISGTPTAVGTFTFTVKAENIKGTDEKEFTVEISKAQGAAVAAPKIAGKWKDSLEITAVETTNGQSVEYSIDGTTWQTSTKFSGLSEYTDYTIYARSAANANYTEGTTASVVLRTADSTPPTGEITISGQSFTSYNATVDFNLFFNEPKTITITAADNVGGSGVMMIEYQIRTTPFASEDVARDGEDWIRYNPNAKPTIARNSKGIVYARITDNDGNVTVINSDGVVVYTDMPTAMSGVYQYGSGEAFTLNIPMYGNTVKEILGSSTFLNPSTDYTVGINQITFTEAFMETLTLESDGSDMWYDFGVLWNPLGETASPAAGSDRINTTTLTIRITSRPVNTVTVNSDRTMGTASANMTTAAEGDTVQLSMLNADGYRFVGYTVVSGGVTIVNDGFVMGDSPVVITAEFVVVPPPPPPTDNNTGGGGGGGSVVVSGTAPTAQPDTTPDSNSADSQNPAPGNDSSTPSESGNNGTNDNGTIPVENVRHEFITDPANIPAGVQGLGNVTLPESFILLTFNAHGEFSGEYTAEVSADELVAAGLDIEKVGLYYIADDGTVTDCSQYLTKNPDGSLTITVTHASAYVLAETAPVGTNNAPRATNPATGAAMPITAVMFAGSAAVLARKRK
ncbi:MAG: putative Ig domain-containing protein [Oscillospiraceae bacterium]|nr:putative Ig domain-containing protein [Oscillospiraceae bacterium]